MELRSNDNIATRYHKIFDYKLTKEEAVKWQYKNQKVVVNGKKSARQLQREKYSKKKRKIAENASNVISILPTVLFVGITGSLAMNNTNKDSDIDLLIVTKKDTLWLTRPLVYFLLLISNFKIRKPNTKDEKDKLCLNMWFDETGLIWNKKERNIFTAHEMAQIVALVNKNKTYERILFLNKWVLDYWPNAVKIENIKYKNSKSKENKMLKIIENLFFKIQYLYMRRKITHEVITPTIAIFHPNDWGKKVIESIFK